MDVDKFLTRQDFKNMKLKWPWKLTHFVLLEKCFGCKSDVDGFTRPSHFVLRSHKISSLKRTPFFWCNNCGYFAIYIHYPSDECTYCN